MIAGEKKYKKGTYICLKIVQLVLLCIFLYSSYKIAMWYFHNKVTQKNLEIVEKHVSESVIDIIDDDGNTETKEYLEVDFDAIKELNSDTVAYLEIKNLDIKFPVVQSTNNYYYLTRSFDKSYNEAGWIFADYRNKIDETDKNVILYGHNRKNATMFGNIEKAFVEEWYTNKENVVITFVTENGYYEYEIFSMYIIEKEDYYISTDFNGDDYTQFLEIIESRSIYNFNVDLHSDDQILTLSTCTDTTAYRQVIHAKLINKIIK